jgi:hypothetical protein
MGGIWQQYGDQGGRVCLQHRLEVDGWSGPQPLYCPGSRPPTQV